MAKGAKKVCRRCKKEQPMDQFHKNGGTGDGKSATCKTCTSEMDEVLRNSKKNHLEGYTGRMPFDWVYESIR